MNPWILVAAGLSAMTVLVHLFAGGQEVHEPILASCLSVPLKAYGSILWPAVTIVLAVNSAALLLAARTGELQRPLVFLTVGQYAGFAGLFVFYGLTRLESLMPMPQWIVFTLIAVVAIIGIWRSPAPVSWRVPA